MIPNKFGDNDSKRPEDEGTNGALLNYVMERVEYGRRCRDEKYAQRWKEYTRLWRGFYTDEDANTDSERSKLIAPALQQAVEMTVAEMEESVFARESWFDITDDIQDENKDDAIEYRDQLKEDFEQDDVPSAISKSMLMAAIYGTGIAKLNVVRKEEKQMVDGEVVSSPRISVPVECIRPDEFVIDPAALSIETAEFVAHEPFVPQHIIRQKQRKGTYKGRPIDAWHGEKADTDGTGKKADATMEDRGVKITEYYGLIPGYMITEGGKGLVESIVTIANERVVLKAVKSPFSMADRPVVAYPHDIVPGEFWGRGVCEKGYNPQKALDAELRARIDTLALTTAPMMGADLTRLPRNPDMRVRPGKTLFTRGRPSEIFEPISFGNPSLIASSFQHSGDLERMVQMGTGAMDSATPVGVNARNETASGISQLQAGFIKRSKRTMQNLERQFLDPLIRKALWRYMQFDPGRYPVDFKFTVNATMGIMAKEVENAQLINMLGFLPPDSPAQSVLVQAIFDNSASANRKELKEAIAQLNKPPSEEEQRQQQELQKMQMEIQKAELDLAKAEAQKEAALAQKAIADAEYSRARANHENIEADLEDDKLDILAAQTAVSAQKVREQSKQTEVAAARVRVEAQKTKAAPNKE